MRHTKRIFPILIISMLLSISVSFAAVNSDKVGILITEWGTPARYIFEYSWDNNYWCRVGDLTESKGQPGKIGHVASLSMWMAFPVMNIQWNPTFRAHAWG